MTMPAETVVVPREANIATIAMVQPDPVVTITDPESGRVLFAIRKDGTVEGAAADATEAARIFAHTVVQMMPPELFAAAPAVATDGDSIDDVARRFFAQQDPDRDYEDLRSSVQIGWLRKAHTAILAALSRPAPVAVAWRYRYPNDTAWQLTQDHDQAFKNTGEVEPLGVIPFAKPEPTAPDAAGLRAALKPFDVVGIPDWGDDEKVYLTCDGQDLGSIALGDFRRLARARSSEPGGGAVRRGMYVASRASTPERPDMWRKLRDQGHPIISTWIDEAGEGESHDLGELWDRILHEVTSAERLVLYVEAGDFPLKGAYVEVGMALAAGVPVFVVAPGVTLDARSLRPLGSWAKHPLVSFCDTVEEAFAALAATPPPMQGGG